MYFITTKRMLEVCFSAHPNIQYRTICFRGCRRCFRFTFLLFCAMISIIINSEYIIFR